MNLRQIVFLHRNVFRGNAVGKLHGFGARIRYQNGSASAQRGLSYFISTGGGSDFAPNLPGELFGSADKDGKRIGIMLSLRDQIGSDITCLATMAHDQDL